VTYAELMAALMRDARTRRAQRGSASDAAASEAVAGDAAHGVTLLGSHGHTEREAAAATGERDAAVAERLNQQVLGLGGREAGAGARAALAQVAEAARDRRIEQLLRQAISRTLLHDGRLGRLRRHEQRATRTALRHHDRRAPARERLAQAFGAPRPLLFDDHRVHEARVPGQSCVYLDVSGSMYDLLPPLRAALAPLRRELGTALFLFSTAVFASDGARFDRGQLRSTGGTDMDAVLRHLLARPAGPPCRVLIVTDGYVGRADPARLAALAARGITLHAAVCGWHDALPTCPWAAVTIPIVLPPLTRRPL